MTAALAFLRGVPQFVWIALAMLAAAGWLDHRGYQRATADAEQARLERVLANQKLAAEIARNLDQELAELARQTGASLAAIDKEDRTIVQPIIDRALAGDPGLASRVCLNGELLDAINTARGHPGAGAKAEDLGSGAARVP